MTMQSSGAISLSQIQTEFGGSNPVSMNEYYVGGANVSSNIGAFNPNGIPSSGSISFNDFYGASGCAETWSATVNPGARTAPYTEGSVGALSEYWGYHGSNQATITDTTPDNGTVLSGATILKMHHSRFTVDLGKAGTSITHNTHFEISGVTSSNINTDTEAFDQLSYGSYVKLRSAATYTNAGGGVHRWIWTNTSTDTSTSSRTLSLDCFV
tara:strand:+ start:1134 stop:1769 length:636 start_codon:yes stop_codon:yes gene_type:complete